MSRNELVKKLESAIEDAIRTRLYGHIELEFRAGEPVFLRKLQQEKLYDDTESRGYGHRYRE